MGYNVKEIHNTFENEINKKTVNSIFIYMYGYDFLKYQVTKVEFVNDNETINMILYYYNNNKLNNNKLNYVWFDSIFDYFNLIIEKYENNNYLIIEPIEDYSYGVVTISKLNLTKEELGKLMIYITI